MKNIATGAVLLGGIAAFFSLGGTKGIGEKLGGGLKTFGDSLISPFTSGESIVSSLTATSPEQIVNTANLGGNVTNIPSNFEQTIKSPREKDIVKGSLTIAGLIDSLGLTDKVNLQSGTIVREGQFQQPIDFAIQKDGLIKTGTVGLSPTTIAAQQNLSQKFGIATFDKVGNLSSFGGFVSG